MRAGVRMMTSCSLGERGFTLIELLVVMAIVSALMVAFGAGFAGWREKFKAESDTKQLESAFLDAQTRAQRERRVFFVNIPESDPYVLRIYRDEPVNASKPSTYPGDGFPDETKDKLVEEIRFNNIIDVYKDYRSFWFDASGYLRHRATENDFQIRFKVWDSGEKKFVSTQADFNCVFLSPPVYMRAGIWNATEEQEFASPGTYQELRVNVNETALNYHLCVEK